MRKTEVGPVDPEKEEMRSILQFLVDNGQFYISCIELDSYKMEVDGEKILERIEKVLSVGK